MLSWSKNSKVCTTDPPGYCEGQMRGSVLKPCVVRYKATSSFPMIWLRGEGHPGERFGRCDDLGLKLFVDRTPQVNSLDWGQRTECWVSEKHLKPAIIIEFKTQNQCEGHFYYSFCLPLPPNPPPHTLFTTSKDDMAILLGVVGYKRLHRQGDP